jgi:hypothetical protein
MDTNDSPAGRFIQRRQFVVTSAVVPGLWWVGLPLGWTATARATDGELKILTPEQAAILTAVARTIAPHDGLPDQAYRSVVTAIDQAAADAPTHATLNSGLNHLGKRFASDSEQQRVRTLKSLEHSEFFRLLRSNTLETLYSSALAYSHFGYEGEAFSKGGYLSRGFNDLTWLPDVPLEDSGPVIGQEP